MEAVSTKRKFTIDEYHQMAQAGILSENDRVELINGEIINMSPVGNDHAKTVRRINKLFNIKLPEYIIDQQNPVKISEYSEPEPDIVVLPFRDDFYPTGVTPQDVLLLIEVSDTSLYYDINTKLPLYAKAGIPEVWIIDLNRNFVYTYCNPQQGVYQEKNSPDQNAIITASKLNLTVKVKDIIG